MKFTLNRNDVLASKSGHTIEFKKGEPTYVPKELHKEALGFGASPVEGEVEFEAPEKSEAIVDQGARDEMITIALQSLKETNSPNDFAATGYPKVSSVKAIVGFDVRADEIKPVWEALAQADAK
jgi:hypothetical protein